MPKGDKNSCGDLENIVTHFHLLMFNYQRMKKWMVQLVYGLHNHSPVKQLERHLYVGRLSNEEMEIISDISKSIVLTREILLMLK